MTDKTTAGHDAAQVTACDMATASAQGFRDGRASLPLPGAQEAVATVFTMEALTPGGGVKYHATIHKPLPAGTKLYAAPQPALSAGWQPIETAPKDGTLILAAIFIHCSNGESAWQRHAIYFDAERDCTYIDGGDDTGWEFDDYEFWQPLPPSPSMDGESNGGAA